jgi:uncharacterized protein
MSAGKEARMKPLVVFALLLGAFTAAPAQAPTAATKIQALIITGRQVGHEWKPVEPVLRKILEDSGRFEVRVTEEFRGAGPETLAPYDVVILNYCDGRDAGLRWGERADNALLEYVRGGKGLVMFHYSVAAFNGWAEYEKLAGGVWRTGNGHHSARHDFTVQVKDREHPITAGLNASYPHPNDELYANLKWQPVGTYRVLATAWDDHSLYTNARDTQPRPGPGRDEPILWTLDYGKGRVFADMLGHDPDAMKSEIFTLALTRGAEWAATGAVK